MQDTLPMHYYHVEYRLAHDFNCTSQVEGNRASLKWHLRKNKAAMDVAWYKNNNCIIDVDLLSFFLTDTLNLHRQTQRRGS